MSILRVLQPSIAPNEWNVVQSQRQAIAILLLDAENIQLCAEEERFLETCCNHSLQIKIAFANWRAVSKQQDLELHERGYQMIHVPVGKNSADMKMTAVGSSLFVTYPNVKEVLVCSSDGDLAHLCNTLQVYGLTAYAVTRQSESLRVTNSTTGQVFQHQQKPPTPIIPPIEECLNNIKALIQAQHSTSSHWVDLSGLSKKFQETYGFTLSHLVRHYTPGKKARNLFVDRPQEFVIHQVAEKSAIYISLFTSADQQPISLKVPAATQSVSPIPSSSKVCSRQALGQALVTALSILALESKSGSVKITDLLTQFHKQQGLPIKHFLQALEIDQKPVAFLKTCPMFELELIQRNWQVKLVKR